MGARREREFERRRRFEQQRTNTLYQVVVVDRDFVVYSNHGQNFGDMVATGFASVGEDPQALAQHSITVLLKKNALPTYEKFVEKEYDRDGFAAHCSKRGRR